MRTPDLSLKTTAALFLVGCFGSVCFANEYRCGESFVAEAVASGQTRPREWSSSKSGLRAKFVHSALTDQFDTVFDLISTGEVRVRLLLKAGSLSSDKEFRDDLEKLKVRGLRVVAQAESERLSGSEVILAGPAEVVLPIFRRTEVTEVREMNSVRELKAPVQEQFLSAKFESFEVYRTFRRAFVRAQKGYQFFAMLRFDSLMQISGSDLHFLSDLNRLGVQLRRGFKSNDGQSFEVSGSIDSIYALIRSPVIKGVTRIEPVLTEAQELERAQNESRARIQIHEAIKLHPYQNVQIALQDVSEVAGDYVLPAIRDAVRPSLIYLERREDVRSVIPHEEKTAQDYAVFVRRRYGHDFAYVPEFATQPVPIFDGLVLDSENQTVLANVSLKYASEKPEHVSIETLLDELVARVRRHESKLNPLKVPEEWFRVANGLPPELRDAAEERNFSTLIDRSVLLGRLFGVLPNLRGGAQRRLTRLVVDFRDHGYSVDFFRSSKVKKALIQMMKTEAPKELELTLIWNATDAVEISRTRVRVFTGSERAEP